MPNWATRGSVAAAYAEASSGTVDRKAATDDGSARTRSATWSAATTRGDVYPRKARPEQKIDAAVALMMAIGRAMESPAQELSIYDRAELWTA